MMRTPQPLIVYLMSQKGSFQQHPIRTPITEFCVKRFNCYISRESSPRVRVRQYFQDFLSPNLRRGSHCRQEICWLFAKPVAFLPADERAEPNIRRLCSSRTIHSPFILPNESLDTPSSETPIRKNNSIKPNYSPSSASIMLPESWSDCA